MEWSILLLPIYISSTSVNPFQGNSFFSENSFLKNDINIKQKVIDSILEHNSNMLNYQCCRGSEKANNEIYEKSSETREKKLKASPDKNRNRGSNRNNTNVTARKHNDKRSQSEGKDEVRGNKTPKKDIVIIGDSMIKYVNGREISSSVKIRSHPGVTTEDLIDYVRPTARKKPENDGYSLWYQRPYI